MSALKSNSGAESSISKSQPFLKHGPAGTCYFDNNATSPMNDTIVDVLKEAYRNSWGNPSSLHGMGRVAHFAILDVENMICVEIDSPHAMVVFTGSGTEANNLALIGFWEACCKPGDRIIASKIEHLSVLRSLEALELKGADIILTNPDPNGVVNVTELESHINKKTKLISVMSINNELGTIQPIQEIGNLAKKNGIKFHTDAVQAIGKIPVSMSDLNIDMLTFSAHKFHGPRGIGALVVAPGVPIKPITYGGGMHENLRPGTKNTPGIVGLGAALKYCRDNREDIMNNRRALDSYLLSGIAKLPYDIHLNTNNAERIPGVFNLRVDGTDADSMIQHLDYFGVCVSRGSACSAANPTLSHVLTAMGLSETQMQGSFRLSMGTYNTKSEIDWFLHVLPPVIECLHKSPDKTAFLGRILERDIRISASN